MKNVPFKVQKIFQGNWITHSTHRNLENAEVNMEVYYAGHKSPVRIVHDGAIIAVMPDNLEDMIA
jgi:hypothetical protein